MEIITIWIHLCHDGPRENHLKFTVDKLLQGCKAYGLIASLGKPEVLLRHAGNIVPQPPCLTNDNYLIKPGELPRPAGNNVPQSPCMTMITIG